MSVSVDFGSTYVLPADLRVVQRDEHTVQVGTEAPRRVMVLDAPDDAAEVLARLNGAMSAGDAVGRSGGDPLVWRSVLSSLLATGLLVPAPAARSASSGKRTTTPAHLTGERLSLIHQHGVTAADRLLRARSDALVVLDGTGPVAETTATLLAAAGVGHVHQRDAGPPDPGVDPEPVARAAPSGAWRAAPTVRVHRPAPQVPPSVVVLAGRTLPSLSRAAQLVTSLIPHLAVRVTQARVIVGPLVLPGRSACLNCMERHRTAKDPGWPSVATALREHPVTPPVLAAHAAAEMAAGQVLDLLDGLHRPEAVGATIERHAGSLQVHRRSWPPHPECGCRLLSGQL